MCTCWIHEKRMRGCRMCRVMCRMSRGMYHRSITVSCALRHVIYRVSCVMCRMSCVMWHVSWHVSVQCETCHDVSCHVPSAMPFSSAMELETCCRLRLPILFLIINNNGIYYGLERNPTQPHDIPVTSLTCHARYEMISHAFGGYGYYVDSPDALLPTLQRVMQHKDHPCVVNICIKPEAERKKQSHGWLSDANTSAAAQKPAVTSKL